MSARSRLERILGVAMVCGCALVALAMNAPAVAEVGVALQEVSGATSAHGPYILGIIVDDPDPITNGWTRLSSEDAPRDVLNELGDLNGDGKPSILYNTWSHLPIVAWSRNSPSGFDVVVSRFEGNQWTPPQVIAGASEDELDPFLIQDPNDGSVHLFYWIVDATPHVEHRVAPANLQSWSAPTTVSAPGEVSSRPAAVFHDGELHVVYESHGSVYGSFPRHIVMASGSMGNGFSYYTLTATLNGMPNWPRVHRNSIRFWVDWVDDEGVMTWTRRDASGAWGPFEIEPFSGAEELHYHVRGKVRSRVLEEP